MHRKDGRWVLKVVKDGVYWGIMDKTYIMNRKKAYKHFIDKHDIEEITVGF